MKRAILFTDIGGSTELYRRIGDESAHALISELLRAIAQQIETLGGRVLRTVGDAVLAEFLSCDTALSACRKIHSLPAAQNLQVRAGFHWGEVIADAGDVYGDAVNLAARLCSFAQVGETVLSEAAKLGIGKQQQQHLILLDVASFKGFDKPIDVYRDSLNQNQCDQTGIFLYQNRDQESRRAALCELALSFENQRVRLTNNGDCVLVGRSSQCDLHLAMPSVSKTHAKIECRRGRYVYTDCSTNGSFIVKGAEPYVFVHRDSITLDATGFIYLGTDPQNLEMMEQNVPVSIPQVEFRLNTLN